MVRGHLKVEIPGEFLHGKTCYVYFNLSYITRHSEPPQNVRKRQIISLQWTELPFQLSPDGKGRSPRKTHRLWRTLSPNYRLSVSLLLPSSTFARARAHPPSPARPPSRKRAFCLAMGRFLRFVIWEASFIGMAGLIVNSYTILSHDFS